MDYIEYENWLAHSRGPWKKHGYVSKYKKNGKWVYVYGNVKGKDFRVKKSTEQLENEYDKAENDFDKAVGVAKFYRPILSADKHPYTTVGSDDHHLRKQSDVIVQQSRDAGRAQERFARAEAELRKRREEEAAAKRRPLSRVRGTVTSSGGVKKGRLAKTNGRVGAR